MRDCITVARRCRKLGAKRNLIPPGDKGPLQRRDANLLPGHYGTQATTGAGADKAVTSDHAKDGTVGRDRSFSERVPSVLFGGLLDKLVATCRQPCRPSRPQDPHHRAACGRPASGGNRKSLGSAYPRSSIASSFRATTRGPTLGGNPARPAKTTSVDADENLYIIGRRSRS